MKALPSEDLEVFARIRCIIGLLRRGQIPDTVQRTELAWIITRVMARMIPILTVVDGSFAGLVEHSWLLGPAGSVIDVCPPNAYGGPLIYGDDALFESNTPNAVQRDEELSDVVAMVVADMKARSRVMGM